jgi:hypothetical protein
MDRTIVYPGSIPLDSDLLSTNRNTMVALGALLQATLGTTPVIDGLAVTPTIPASLSVIVSPGSITQATTVDQNAYGSLAADATDALVKMGINLTATTLTLAAPTTSGQSVNHLIEAAFVESDTSATVLPYYNAANPAQPYLGPNNTGTAQATSRIQRVQLQLKAGTPATAGTQTTPPVDNGWSGIAVVTVNYGQTQVTSANIAQASLSPALAWKLPALRPGFPSLQAFTSSSSFTIPVGVTRLKVTVIGGGGAGGTHGTTPSGGGGGGGHAIRVLTGMTPGTVIPVTVGPGGTPLTGGNTGNGGAGGTSSFGIYASATGGNGGGGGSGSAPAAGGSGGNGVGGDINYGGSFGTDGVIPAARGGDGGGPGAGRGTTGAVQGISANGPGGGGGGGGASSTTGAGTGAPGGTGGAGLVIVEF